MRVYPSMPRCSSSVPTIGVSEGVVSVGTTGVVSGTESGAVSGATPGTDDVSDCAPITDAVSGGIAVATCSFSAGVSRVENQNMNAAATGMTMSATANQGERCGRLVRGVRDVRDASAFRSAAGEDAGGTGAAGTGGMGGMGGLSGTTGGSGPGPGSGSGSGSGSGASTTGCSGSS